MKVRGLWGLEIEPEKASVVLVDGSFKITMASISGFQGQERTSVYMEFQDSRFLLCSLIPEKIEQQVIDITCLKGERILFRSVGPNGIHLMGNYVSQDDSESESDEEEIENIDVSSHLNGYPTVGSIKGSIGDSDNDLYVDAPDVLGFPDMSNETVVDDDEFDVGYICNFLETTFGSKESLSILDKTLLKSDPSNPFTVNKKLADPLLTSGLAEVVENTDTYNLQRKGNSIEQEPAERIEVEKLKVEERDTEKRLVENLSEDKKLEALKRATRKLEAKKQVAEKIEADRRAAKKLEAERSEVERLEVEKLETERSEAEKSKADKLKADKLTIEKLKAEKLKAEKRVPKKRVHSRQEFIVPETVELGNTTSKNSVNSGKISKQVVHRPRPKRSSRNATPNLYVEKINLIDSIGIEDQISTEYQMAEINESNNVSHNVDTNSTTVTKAPSNRKTRNSKSKDQITKSLVKQSSVEQSLVKNTPVEHSPVEHSPVEQSPVEQNLVELSQIAKSSLKEVLVKNKPVRSSSRNQRTPIANCTRSKSPISKKEPVNTPIESTPTGTEEKTDVKEPTNSMAKTRAKRYAKKLPVEENLVEHIEEVDSIASGTETTPLEKSKSKRSRVLKAEKAEKTVTPSHFENTSIESSEVEQPLSKYAKEPVKQIEQSVEKENIDTVSPELTVTEKVSSKIKEVFEFINKIKVEEGINQVDQFALQEELTDAENISNKKTKNRKTKKKPVRKNMEEILDPKTDVPIKPSNNTKDKKLKKAYQNTLTAEEGTKKIEAKIPNVKTTSKKEEPTSKKEKPTSKKEETTSKKEETTSKKEETTSKKEKTKINKNTASTAGKGPVKNIPQEIPMENNQDTAQKNNDKLEFPTISNSSRENKRTKVDADLKKTVPEEESIGDSTCSFEDLLRIERERKKLAKLKKKKDKRKRKEAEAMQNYKKEAGDYLKESSKGQEDTGAPAYTPAANTTKETFKKQSNAKSPAAEGSFAQKNSTSKRKGEEEESAQRKKNVHKKRKL